MNAMHIMMTDVYYHDTALHAMNAMDAMTRVMPLNAMQRHARHDTCHAVEPPQRATIIVPCVHQPPGNDAQGQHT